MTQGIRQLVASTQLILVTAIYAAAQQPIILSPAKGASSGYIDDGLPGYAPTAGALLTLNLSAGTAYCGSPQALATYIGGTLAMTASATNYVFLDPTAG